MTITAAAVNFPVKSGSSEFPGKDIKDMRSARPTVSVIVPVYNCAAYLGEAVASVLDQSWRDLELIVIDDGSTDDFPGAVQAYESDPRLVVVRQPHGGISAARNTGLRRVRGEMVGFLDADDLWPSRDQLAEQVAFLEAHPEIGLVFGDARPFDARGVRGRPYLESSGYYSPPIDRPITFPLSMKLFCTSGFFLPTGTILLRRACLDQGGLFDESLRMFEDVDLWLRISHQCQVAFFPKVMLDRREHHGNTGERRFLFVDDFVRFLEKHNAAEHGLSIERYAALAYVEAARYHLRRGEAGPARHALMQSMRHRMLPRQLPYLALAMLNGRLYRMLRGVSSAIRAEPAGGRTGQGSRYAPQSAGRAADSES